MGFLARMLQNFSELLRGLLRLGASLLRGLFTALLALILLFEEWGWRPLAEFLALLARFRLWSRAEGWIAGLPPYGALIVFTLPTLLLLPVKLGAFYLLAQGKVLVAGLFLALAKIVSTALIARIFSLTRPSLMQLSWFASLYNWLVPWKEAIFANIRATWPWRYSRMLKTKAAREIRNIWAQWRPWLSARWKLLRRRVARLRWKLVISSGWIWQRLRRALKS